MQEETQPHAGRMEELKEVKFVIPLRHHINLHSWKLLQNQSISATVSTALEQFLARHSVQIERAVQD